MYRIIKTYNGVDIAFKIENDIVYIKSQFDNIDIKLDLVKGRWSGKGSKKYKKVLIELLKEHNIPVALV